MKLQEATEAIGVEVKPPLSHTVFDSFDLLCKLFLTSFFSHSIGSH